MKPQIATCRLPLGAALLAGIFIAASGADAGGTIGWADAMTEFADEGVAVGAAAVVLGIMAVGAILMFGITGLIATVVMVTLGGALMAKAQDIADGLFGGSSGGGGDICATAQAVEHQAPCLRFDAATGSAFVLD